MSRDSRDGSEPGVGSEWDVCTPAATDAACTITLASAVQPSTRVKAAAQDKKPPPDTHTAAFHDMARSDSADVAPKLSVSPAYSMLPWDKPGMWPAAKDSMQSVEFPANMHPSTAAADAPSMDSGALSAPIPFMRQRSRLSVTAAGSLQQSSLPEGRRPHVRSLDSRIIHDSRQQAEPRETASAQRHQHDGISSRADRLPLAGNPSVTLSGFASVEDWQQGGTAAQSDPVNPAHRREASSPSASSAGFYKEDSHLSKEAFVAELLGHMQAPPQASRTAFPAQGNPAEQVVGTGYHYMSMMESQQQAVVWERPFSKTSDDGGSADAEIQSSHHWLSMHGYSDAAVQVTATLADAALPTSIPGSDGKHVAGPSPVIAPQWAQKLADHLHSSNPSGLSISTRKQQLGPPLEANTIIQTDVGHLWPSTASSRFDPATDPVVPPARSAQNPMNGQDVALKRTVPSIWDLDM